VETSDSVIEPYLTLLGDAAELWSGDAARPGLTARAWAAGRALAERAGRRQVALRFLTRTAADLDAVAWLQQQAGDDADLGWRALVRKAELGGDTAAEMEDLLVRDPDPDSKFRALAVRAATPDAAEKAAIWQLMVSRSIPIGSFRPVAGSFWRPGQEELLAPYTEAYLRLLPELDRGGMIPAMYYTARLFPLFAVDEAYLVRAEAATRDQAPVVRKTLLAQSDLMRRMLRSRG
jgi:aminopeptidase N